MPESRTCSRGRQHVPPAQPAARPAARRTPHCHAELRPTRHTSTRTAATARSRSGPPCSQDLQAALALFCRMRPRLLPLPLLLQTPDHHQTPAWSYHPRQQTRVVCKALPSSRRLPQAGLEGPSPDSATNKMNVLAWSRRVSTMASPRPLRVGCVLVALATVAFAASSDVLIITDANLEAELAKAAPGLLLEFYAPVRRVPRLCRWWCGVVGVGCCCGCCCVVGVGCLYAHVTSAALLLCCGSCCVIHVGWPRACGVCCAAAAVTVVLRELLRCWCWVAACACGVGVSTSCWCALAVVWSLQVVRARLRDARDVAEGQGTDRED